MEITKANTIYSKAELDDLIKSINEITKTAPNNIKTAVEDTIKELQVECNRQYNIDNIVNIISKLTILRAYSSLFYRWDLMKRIDKIIGSMNLVKL